MPKVRFLQDTTFEGRMYALGSEHELPEEKAAALGASVERVSRTSAPDTKDTTEIPATNKMVKGAPRKK